MILYITVYYWAIGINTNQSVCDAGSNSNSYSQSEERKEIEGSSGALDSWLDSDGMCGIGDMV